VSSSKLQHCLELCDLPRRFLRQKLQDGKRISSSRLVKGPMCIIRQNGWRITQDTQLERRVLCLESHCYNKLHPDPKLSTSLRLMIESLTLFVSNPCLTFLSCACVSFTPNQVYNLVQFYHQALSLWLREFLHISYMVP
jgi:hypothetical protein